MVGDVSSEPNEISARSLPMDTKRDSPLPWAPGRARLASAWQKLNKWKVVTIHQAITQLKNLKLSWWAWWKLHRHPWSGSAADGWSWPYFGGIWPSAQVQPMLFPCFFFWSSTPITTMSSTDHRAIGQIQPWVAPGLSELSPSARVTFNMTAKNFFFFEHLRNIAILKSFPSSFINVCVTSRVVIIPHWLLFQNLLLENFS